MAARGRRRQQQEYRPAKALRERRRPCGPGRGKGDLPVSCRGHPVKERCAEPERAHPKAEQKTCVWPSRAKAKHEYGTVFGTGGAEQGRRKTPHGTATIEGTRSAYWGHLRTEERTRIRGTITAHGKSLRKASTERRESARGGVQDVETIEPTEGHTRHARRKIRRTTEVTGGPIEGHTWRTNSEWPG